MGLKELYRERLSPEEEIDRSLEALRDPDAEDKEFALQLLEQHGATDAIPAILEFLERELASPTHRWEQWTVDAAWQTLRGLWTDQYASDLLETVPVLRDHFAVGYDCDRLPDMVALLADLEHPVGSQLATVILRGLEEKCPDSYREVRAALDGELTPPSDEAADLDMFLCDCRVDDRCGAG